MPTHHYAMPGKKRSTNQATDTILPWPIYLINIPDLGHEAFSSLVDVAVQQPLLPVPHKDDKRSNIPVSEPPPHHEIRFHPHMREYSINTSEI